MKNNIKKTVLIIEDDSISAELLMSVLKKEDFSVIISNTATEGLEILNSSDVNVLLLDLNLPDMEGMNVLKHIYKNPKHSKVSVIIISSRKEEVDVVVGFEFGADDYIIKPIRPLETIARIKACILKKQFMGSSNSENIKFGDNEFDFNSKQLKRNGKFIKLTAKEYNLLLFLITNPNRIFSRDEILNKLWYFNSVIDTRTVDVHINRLRKKIKDMDCKYIETIRGMGYKFNI